MRLLVFVLAALILCPQTAASQGWRGNDYPQVGYLGIGAWNGLAGLQVEIANPVGSVFILAGAHLDAADVDQWEKGGQAGFMAGLRFLNGGGLESGWHGTLFGGTLDVETRREDGERAGYQRLGGGAGLGYQWLTGRIRAGFTIGAGYVESIRTHSGRSIDGKVLPVGEASIGLRF